MPSPATWSAHIFQWGKRNTKGRTAAPSAGSTYSVQEWNTEGVKSDGPGDGGGAGFPGVVEKGH